MTDWADDPAWLVAIRDRHGQIAGAGSLVTPSHILTCAHVVERTMPAEAPTGPVLVTSGRSPGAEPVLGRVVAWDASEDADVAVLEIPAPLPGAAPAPLGVVRDDAAQAAVGSWGYPPRVRDRPQPWTGTVIAVQGGRIVLESRSPGGFDLEAGFSGGGLWDEHIGALIGVVSERLTARRPDAEVPAASPRVGIAVRLDVVARVWPDLPRRSAFGPDRLNRLTTLPLVDGRLPMTREVTPESLHVGQHGPYVLRHGIDADLDATLQAALVTPRSGSPLVLVVGAAAAGKSRTAFEAVQRLEPAPALLVPESPEALAELASGPLPVPGAGGIIWLDDVEELLVPSGFEERILDRLARHEPPLAMVATLRTAGYLRLTNPLGDRVKRFARMLAAARRVAVPDSLEAGDLDAAREAYPRLDLDGGRLGPELMSSGPLETMYALGRDVSPVGWALLRAAVDWGRTGAASPVPEAVLRRTVALYLGSDIPPGEPEINAGLAWACGLGDGAIAEALRRSDGEQGRCYRPAKYLLEHVESHHDDGGAVPAEIWQAVADMPAVPGHELLQVVYRALAAGLPDVALDLLRVLIARADPKVGPFARIALGELYLTRGEHDRAESALMEARDAGNPDVRYVAQADLGSLAIARDDLGAAESLLEEALRSDEPAVRRFATANLAVLRWRQGDTATARTLLEGVLSSANDPRAAPSVATAQLGLLLAQPSGRSGKPSVARNDAPAQGLQIVQDLRSISGATITETIAKTQLGWLLIDQGEPVRARELLTAALQDDSLVQPLVEAGLGLLDLAEGEVEDAVRHLDAARASSDVQAAALATLSYAMLRHEQGSPEEAEELLAELVASGVTDIAPQAAELLGNMRRQRGDVDGAEEAYRSAIASGHREMAPSAKIALATLLYERDDDAAGAVQLLRDVADTGPPDQAPLAADLLGDLHAQLGDAAAAEGAYRQAIASGHADWAPTAQVDLAMLLKGSDPGGAIDLFRAAAASLHPDQRPRALDLLGDAYEEMGRVAEARAAYLEVVAAEHPYWTPVAHVDLALQGIADDRYDDARAHLDLAAGSAVEVVADQVAFTRALLAIELDDVPAALPDMERAARGTADPIVVNARFWLMVLAVEAGDLTDADVRAEALLEALQRWIGAPPPPTEPEDDARDDLAVPAGRRVLAVWDYLYALDDLTGGPALDALYRRTDLEGWLPAAVRTRRAQQHVLADAPAAVKLLRPALADLDTQPDAPWAEQALARRYLALALLHAHPDLRQKVLDEVSGLLEPFVRRPSRTNGPSALVELGRVKILLGKRLQARQSASHSGLTDVDQWFREGEDLLRRAETEARAAGDDGTVADAVKALKLVPVARNELKALENALGITGVPHDAPVPVEGSSPAEPEPVGEPMAAPGSDSPAARGAKSAQASQAWPQADILVQLASTAAAEARFDEAEAMLSLVPGTSTPQIARAVAMLRAVIAAERGDFRSAFEALRVAGDRLDDGSAAVVRADLELLARADRLMTRYRDLNVTDVTPAD